MGSHLLTQAPGLTLESSNRLSYKRYRLLEKINRGEGGGGGKEWQHNPMTMRGKQTIVF